MNKNPKNGKINIISRFIDLDRLIKTACQVKLEKRI